MDAGPLRLSVVIPVKDDSGPLKVCLQALAQQSTPVFEIIVVDNGSADDSADVARRFGAIVVREDMPGIAAAAGAGYDRTLGELVGRLDADSVPAHDWAERIVEYFSRHPSVSAVTGGAEFADGPRFLRRVGAVLYLGAYFVLVAGALGHTPLFGSNFAMRASAWRATSGGVHRSDGLIHDDMDLSFHLGPHGIRFSPALRVGISSRPFTDGGTRLRLRRGIHSITLHWPEHLPWLRVWARIRGRRASVRPNPAPVKP